MARIRPTAAAGAALARARVLGAIFGEDSTVGAVGRFRVLARLGAGGMGVVYEAYDPELARGVALKLVEVAPEDHEVALAEAKALARLSHPNVVPIYDVGLARGRVYLVMELVRGTILQQWSSGRTPREILGMYQQAGAALAAAHDAGLVHRDFKPQNAIVGADGRVRVVDFGLACEADDPARPATGRRRMGGTPHFMAPEVKRGAAITPAADQYSFCVALGHALAGAAERPPRWIAAVTERGRAADPAERFASMRDLLRALGRDPARTWRRAAAMVSLMAPIGALAFVLGRTSPSAEAGACNSDTAPLDAIWSPAARTADLDRLAGLDQYGQSIRPRLAEALDSYTREWVRADRAACVDRRSSTETDTMSDRRRICLQRGSDALAELRDMVARAGSESLAQLLLAVQSMPDPASCSDPAVVSSDVPPPPREIAAAVAATQTQVTRARVQVEAGQYDPALAVAAAAAGDARKLRYRPLLADALLVQGQAQMDLDPPAAIPILAEATEVAIDAHEDALAIEACARRTFVQGTQVDPDTALINLEVIEHLAMRTTSAAFARALLYNSFGNVELARGRRAPARAYFDRALIESRKVLEQRRADHPGGQTGRGTLELIGIRANLALATDDRVQADRLLADVAGDLAERLGDDHPQTLGIREMRGFATIEDVRQADTVLTPVCQGYELHPTIADGAAPCWTEVGLLRVDLGEPERAIEAMVRATRASGDTAEPVAYLALLRGDPRTAAQQFSRATAALGRPPGEHEPWPLQRSALVLGLGRARREVGDLRGARTALDQTIAHLEPFVRAHPSARLERWLGRARVTLALTLRALNASPAELAPIEVAATEWRRRAGLADRER